ncbi:MAG: hypothetical protein M9932_09630 [Xanthobacteraceae bacterium]|nr:hypothetical protein [Xanthobacteraceae bacterium]
MKAAWISICVAVLLAAGNMPAQAQDPFADQDEVDPAAVRPFWLGASGLEAAAAPFFLDEKARNRFSGTFGIDLSHYTFDRSDKPKCKTQAGYDTAECSCSANWDAATNAGVVHVYTKASDGAVTDLSFQRLWAQLEPKHASKALFRGAYHFLRPNLDVTRQADVFLNAIGAAGGHKPKQLPPVLDIEWSNKRVEPGTEEFDACPAARRTKNDQGVYYCDMWYKMTPAQIAAMAKIWIDRVEAATGLPVLVYTNPSAWWNAVMTHNEDALLSNRGVWTSRYTDRGPVYNKKWTKEGGSPKWKMAPLPRGASYPVDDYSKPHLWQFTETGFLPTNFLTCAGSPRNKQVDMSWVPISQDKFQSVFRLNTP